jgi:LPS export ABC transporter protein LptC
LLALFGCQSRLETATGVMDRNLPDETSYNVKITQFNGTRTDYILEAGKIERFYDRRLLKAYKVDITAFDPKTGESSLLKADTTIVDDARNLIYANGNVFLSSGGGSVSSRRMVWDRNTDEIVAPDKVTLVRVGNVLKGENLRTNTRMDFAVMEKVSAEGFLDEEDLGW